MLQFISETWMKALFFFFCCVDQDQSFILLLSAS